MAVCNSSQTCQSSESLWLLVHPWKATVWKQQVYTVFFFKPLALTGFLHKMWSDRHILYITNTDKTKSHQTITFLYWTCSRHWQCRLQKANELLNQVTYCTLLSSKTSIIFTVSPFPSSDDYEACTKMRKHFGTLLNTSVSGPLFLWFLAWASLFWRHHILMG